MENVPIRQYLILRNKQLNIRFALPPHPVIEFMQIEEITGRIEHTILAHYTMIGNTSKHGVNIYEFQGVEIK